MKIKKKSL